MAEVTWELLRLRTRSCVQKQRWLNVAAALDFPPKISQKNAYSAYSEWSVFRSFCYREPQNEQNDIPFIPKTEQLPKEHDYRLFRVILFRNSPKRTRPKFTRKSNSCHFLRFFQNTSWELHNRRNNAMDQSGNRRQAPQNACEQVTICLQDFTSGWLRKWRNYRG